MKIENYKTSPKFQSPNQKYCLLYCIGYILDLDPDVLITDEINNFLTENYPKRISPQLTDYHNLILKSPFLQKYEFIGFNYNEFKNDLKGEVFTIYPIDAHCIVNISSTIINGNEIRHALVGNLNKNKDITLVYDPDNQLEFYKAKFNSGYLKLEYIDFILIK